jgi:hypothetical protein
MRSLKEWWTDTERPLSARGHLYWMAFWLSLGAITVYRMLTDDGKLVLQILLLVTVLSYLVYLLVGYRNALRAERRPGPHGDVDGATGERDAVYLRADVDR